MEDKRREVIIIQILVSFWENDRTIAWFWKVFVCILVCMNYFRFPLEFFYASELPHLIYFSSSAIQCILSKSSQLSLPQLKRITKIFIQSFQPYQILNQQQIDTYLLFFILWKHEDSLAHTHLGFYRWMQSMYKSSISWIRPSLH